MLVTDEEVQEVFESDGFRFLSQGMKDKKAYAIMIFLQLSQETAIEGGEDFRPLDDFNQFAKDHLENDT